MVSSWISCQSGLRFRESPLCSATDSRGHGKVTDACPFLCGRLSAQKRFITKLLCCVKQFSSISSSQSWILINYKSSHIPEVMASASWYLLQLLITLSTRTWMIVFCVGGSCLCVGDTVLTVVVGSRKAQLGFRLVSVHGSRYTHTPQMCRCDSVGRNRSRWLWFAQTRHMPSQLCRSTDCSFQETHPHFVLI